MTASQSAGLYWKIARLTVPPAVTPTNEPTTNHTASRTLTLPSFLWMAVPMMALANRWNWSVPTAMMPRTPKLMSAGVRMYPPPAPMTPVMSPAMSPTRIEPRNMPVSTLAGISALPPPSAGRSGVSASGQADEVATKRNAGRQTAARTNSRRRLPRILRPASISH